MLVALFLLAELVVFILGSWTFAQLGFYKQQSTKVWVPFTVVLTLVQYVVLHFLPLPLWRLPFSCGFALREFYSISAGSDWRLQSF